MSDYRIEVAEEYAAKVANAVLGDKYGVTTGYNGNGVKVVADSSIDTACTDGDTIWVNPDGVLHKQAVLDADKIMLLAGLVTHECSHVLFSDFAVVGEAERQRRYLQAMWPDGDYTHKQEINDSLKNLSWAKMFSNAFGSFDNIFEDSMIEHYHCKRTQGFYTQCLQYSRLANYNTSPTLEAVLNANADNLLNGAAVLCLSRAFGFPDKLGNAKTKFPKQTDLILRCLDNAMPYIKQLVTETNGKKRIILVNHVMGELFDLMPKPKQLNAQNQEQRQHGKSQNKSGDSSHNRSSSSSSSSSASSNAGDQDAKKTSSSENNDSGKNDGNGNDDTEQDTSGIEQSLTDAELDALAKKIAEMIEKDKLAGTKRPDEDAFEGLQDDEEDENDGSNSVSPPSDSSQIPEELQNLAQSVAERLTQEIQNEFDKSQAEKEHARALQEQAQSMNIGETVFHVLRKSVTRESKAWYYNEYNSVADIIHATVRIVRSVLKSRKPAESTTGYLMGTRFDAKNSYRVDRKCFIRKSLPGKEPDVAFALLIDESGSMSGSKNRYAIKAAIVLDAVLRELKVPFMVSGHSTPWRTCDMNLVHDFYEPDGKDKYRLPLLGADGGNMDGQAIRYCADKLLRQNTEQKVLIILSDGLPSASGTRSLSATEETMRQVELARKNGVVVIAGVLEKDAYERIRAIYGDSTMDMSDLSKLPREMSKMIRRFVLR